MKTKLLSSRYCVLAFECAAVLLLAGCAAQAPAPSRPETASAGLVLEYKMPAGQVLRYHDAEELREVSDVMGQSIETLVTSTKEVSFQAKGQKEGHHLLGVTIDGMDMSVTSPRGNLSPDLKSVKGKSFDMALSPLGMEVDVSGAESITYELAGTPRNIAYAFSTFFPDLPEKPIRIGDSWPSKATIEAKAGQTASRVEMQIMNTFEGLEAVNGLECARITSKITGTISGSGSQGGADFTITGTLKGTDVWHFAPKEGLYVKATSDVVSEQTVNVSGPQALTIPTTQFRKSEVKWTGH